MLIAVLVIITGAVLWKIYSLYNEKDPLDSLPAPPDRLPIIGDVKFMLNITPKTMVPNMNKLSEQLGYRFVMKILQKRSLHVCRPEDLEIILTNSKNITKSLIPYEFLRPWLGSGLITSTGSSWYKRRKLMTPTFHFNILKNFATVMEEKTQAMMQMIKKADGAEMDIFPMISDLALFIICETAMGVQLDSDKSSRSTEYRAGIQGIGNVFMERLSKFYLHNNFIFNFIGGKPFQKYLETVHSFADGVIMDKKKNISGSKEEIASALTGDDVGTKKRVAMLDLLLESERRGEIDLTGIRDEVNTFMFAGHDTSAMALTYCIMMIAEHEDIQNKIVEESSQILQSDRSPTLADLSEMKYLEAVIKETMRLYPSVPFVGREVDEDFKLSDGILVKKGTSILLHIYDLHHRADIYPDPYEFKPERFLGGETRHPYAYIPFSAGPRNCIGQKFAMQEIKLVITQLCRNFRLQPKVKGFRPKLKNDITLRPTEPVYVKFIPRQQ